MSKPKFDRNYVCRKLELVLRDLSVYTADEFWREISRIASGATGLPSAEQLKGHAKELEAINLGLTKTLVEMESEKAELVEALEAIRDLAARDKWMNDFESVLGYALSRAGVARAALAAYRKKGGGA